MPNHGIVTRGISKYVGRNSRLDETMQAIYILERLKNLKKKKQKKQK